MAAISSLKESILFGITISVRVMDSIGAQGTAPSAKERRFIRWARELARHYDPLDVFTLEALDDG